MKIKFLGMNFEWRLNLKKYLQVCFSRNELSCTKALSDGKTNSGTKKQSGDIFADLSSFILGDGE